MKKKTYEHKRAVGTRYEAQAAAYLEGQGYEVVAKNYRTPYAEIDLILRKDSMWIFCEVKYRKDQRYGGPLEAVDDRKQNRISHAALHFYARNGYNQQMSCRFDVVAIYGDDSICHIENAFEFQW